jgi:2-polyprenyl-3-methyl-5-hydroxy-6-metoxy-1,4-benzoquinol methylase
MRLFPLRREEADRWIRHLRRPPGVPSLLDVGCGNGAFLLQMTPTAWSVRGLDPDPEAVAMTREAGVPAEQGFLTDSTFPANHFDAVTMRHVLEHVHEPLELLRICNRIVRPGGVVWIATPNLASAGHRLFGRHWRGLEPPRHVVLLTPEALKDALARVGFEVIAHAPACTARWSFQGSAAISRGANPDIDPAPLPPRLRWRARVTELRALRQPDLAEEIVVVARKPR